MIVRLSPVRPYSDLPVDLQADSEADIVDLPTQNKPGKDVGIVPTGSKCIVLGNGSGASLYGLNSNEAWIKM